MTRDHAGYWDRRPSDHNASGLFHDGPQEKRPTWPYKVKTGSANRAPATETRGAALQRMETERRRRLMRMGLCIAGFSTGRNRRSWVKDLP